jgi:Spy/CpxP family protein refolding chaperone
MNGNERGSTRRIAVAVLLSASVLLLSWISGIQAADTGGADTGDRLLAATRDWLREKAPAFQVLDDDQAEQVIAFWIDHGAEIRGLLQAFGERRDQFLALREELDLSADQREEVWDVARKWYEPIRSDGVAFARARGELRALVLDPESSEAAIRDAALEVGRRAGELAVTLQQAFNEARALLEPDQRTLLDDFIVSGADFRETLLEQIPTCADHLFALLDSLDLSGEQLAALRELRLERRAARRAR